MALGAPCRKQVQAVRREDSEAREFKAEGPGDFAYEHGYSIIVLWHNLRLVESPVFVLNEKGFICKLSEAPLFFYFYGNRNINA